ncbi:hypothetical protein ME783_10980 [Lactobacillus delbrueckii]|nr:hypothetical protein ME783_10980 [Lactobacillus delbrueckii]
MKPWLSKSRPITGPKKADKRLPRSAGQGTGLQTQLRQVRDDEGQADLDELQESVDEQTQVKAGIFQNGNIDDVGLAFLLGQLEEDDKGNDRDQKSAPNQRTGKARA